MDKSKSKRVFKLTTHGNNLAPKPTDREWTKLCHAQDVFDELVEVAHNASDHLDADSFGDGRGKDFQRLPPVLRRKFEKLMSRAQYALSVLEDEAEEWTDSGGNTAKLLNAILREEAERNKH